MWVDIRKLKLPICLGESGDLIVIRELVLPRERVYIGRTWLLALDEFDCNFHLLIYQGKPCETDLVV